jgi:hypothetical protein
LEGNALANAMPTSIREGQMPIFSQAPKKRPQDRTIGGVAHSTVEKYIPFVRELKRGYVGRLELEKDDESILTARKALLAAGEQTKKYVAVRKPRGEQNILEIERISGKEFIEAQKKAKKRRSKK